MKIYIYILRETGDPAIRYIGQTDNLSRRLAMHKQDSRQPKGNLRSLWIADVLLRGSSIEISAIEECSIETAAERENYWIGHYRAAGHILTNARPALDNMKFRRYSKTFQRKQRQFDEDQHRRLTESFYDTYGESP